MSFSIIWILVNCNSKKEAKLIGKEILKKRLCSCFDIIPRHLAVYFWPPKSGKIEESRGATLILETFREKYNSVTKLVKKLHSDQLPFIGFIEIKGLSKAYLDWMKNEIK
jgi:periplasmic divalent cation tolerance protein